MSTTAFPIETFLVKELVQPLLAPKVGARQSNAPSLGLKLAELMVKREGEIIFCIL